MRRLTTVVLALAVTVPAAAGQNPDARAFISFDPDDPSGPYVHYADFESGLIIDSYLVVDCFSETGGMRGIMFSWTTNGIGTASAPEYYLPGALAIGGPDDPVYGWVIAGNDCVQPNELGVVVVLRVSYLMETPGYIELGPNDVDGQKLVDCNFTSDQFCVYASGGVGTPAPPGDEPCDCRPYNPIGARTWGTIKSLYR